MKKRLSAILDRLAWGGSVLILCASLHVMAGCPGFGLSASCTRNPDGTVTCGVDAHRHAEEERKP